MSVSLSFLAVTGIPLLQSGDDLAQILADALARDQHLIEDGDILVIAQKIVSKAEGRMVALASVTPSAEAIELAKETEKDPRLVQLILDESDQVLRKKPGVIIVRHRLGHVGANAGIDQSNIEHEEGESALLLPIDPDASAAVLRQALMTMLNRQVGIIIADSMNRPWRLGTVGGAIGCAGVEVIDDLRGGQDLFGRELKVAMVNTADSIAAAATLVMGETDEKTPMVIVRGRSPSASQERARDIHRPLADDLFG